MSILLYVSIFLSFLFTSLLYKCRSESKFTVINWPFIGMAPSLLRNLSQLHDLATDVLQQNGGTFLFKGPIFSGMDMLVTSDSKNIHYILNKNFSNYQRGQEFREIVESLGDGILAADSENWKFQRRILHTLFNQDWYEKRIENIMEKKILNGLFLVLENASKLRIEVNLQDIFKRLTFDNVTLLNLGFDPKSLSIEFPQIRLENAFHDMENAFFYRYVLPKYVWKLQKWFQIGKEKKFKEAFDISSNFTMECIERKREELGQRKEKIERNNNFDILKYFLTLEGEENDNLIKSNKFLKDMVFNLMGAGRETIASGLIWLFWCILNNPLIEKKILDEIKEILSPNEDNKMKIFSFKELNKLIYLHAVICETLRLYPPAPFDYLESIQSDCLPSGHYVRKNMKIMYFIYSMGRMEEIWGKDCLEFKPERWISERGKIKNFPSYKFTVFNAGPRTCLGKNSAFIQIKAVASVILWNFCVEIVETNVVRPENSLALFMKNGLKVRVSERIVW